MAGSAERKRTMSTSSPNTTVDDLEKDANPLLLNWEMQANEGAAIMLSPGEPAKNVP